MPHPKIKISDNSGNTVDVTDNALDVNIAGGATIDIGDVDLFLDGGTALLGGEGALAAGVLRVTLATDDTLGGTAYADDADWTDGSSKHLLVGGLYQSSPQTVTDGDVAPFSISSTGELNVEMVVGSVWQTYAAANDTDLGSIVTNTAAVLNSVATFGANFASDYGFSRNTQIAGVVRNDALEAFTGIADGDFTVPQVNAIGGLYVTGSEVENAAVQSQPLLIGGRYDSSARTLGDGDAGAIALNASGHLIIDVVDGGVLDALLDTIKVDTEAIETAVELLDNAIDGSEMQVDIVSGTVTANLSATDNAVLDAMVVDLAAMEALLITIDSDTDAIKTAVQILDDWDDSNYANVNINLAGSDAPTGGGAESGALRVTIANDSTGVLTVDGKVGHDISAIVSDVNDDVDTSAEVLKSTTACKRVDLMADPDNAGHIWVGDSGVQNDGTGGGIRLSSGDFYSIDIDNTADIYVAATVADQKVRFIYFT